MEGVGIGLPLANHPVVKHQFVEILLWKLNLLFACGGHWRLCQESERQQERPPRS